MPAGRAGPVRNSLCDTSVTSTARTTAARYDGAMHPNARHRFAPADAIALATLVATGVAVAWPLLVGGATTYVDNPMHLAEIHSLAFEARRGWSGIAYCGVPLGHLHSPLWYGILGWIVRAGAPAVPFYTLALWVGFMAPALALYGVARRHHLPAAAAAGLAYVLLVQRTSVVGLGAALGGMWTFYLGCGLWILLADRMTRALRTTRDAAWIAALVGVVTLTHLFLIVPTVLLALVHVAWSLRRPRLNARPLALQAAAGVLGVLVAAVYWGPMLYTRDALSISGHTLTAPMVFVRLLLPTQIVPALVGQWSLPSFGVMLEAVPMIVLCVGGVAGLFWVGHRAPRVAAYGAGVAVLVLLMVTVGRGRVRLVTGPITWRLLTVVQVALALGAMPLCAALTQRAARLGTARLVRAASLVAVVLAVSASFLWNQSLRTGVVTAGAPEMRDVHAVWDWLRTHARSEWGRVYVQDTSFAASAPQRLRHSHVMARTAAETGVHQVGAAYSAVPFPTARWTTGEFGTVFGSRLRQTADLQRVREAAWRSNTTHLVLCDPEQAARLAGTGLYEPTFRSGPFTVLRDVNAHASWADFEVAAAAGGVGVERYETGHIRLHVESDAARAAVVVKEAHHPFWTADGVAVERDDWGLIRIAGLPAGTHSIVLDYAPPRWPLAVSIIAALVACGLATRRVSLVGNGDR